MIVLTDVVLVVVEGEEAYKVPAVGVWSQQKKKRKCVQYGIGGDGERGGGANKKDRWEGNLRERRRIWLIRVEEGGGGEARGGEGKERRPRAILAKWSRGTTPKGTVIRPMMLDLTLLGD